MDWKELLPDAHRPLLVHQETFDLEKYTELQVSCHHGSSAVRRIPFSELEQTGDVGELLRTWIERASSGFDCPCGDELRSRSVMFPHSFGPSTRMKEGRQR